MISISVIVTTYERPKALNAVLKSLSLQTKLPTEIIIADDGSRDKTRSLIKSWQPKIICPLIHVWQEDKGFRAARVRNLGVLSAKGNYLIFLDGDCIVFPDFISQHMYLAEANYMVMGNRILCSPSFTHEIESNGLLPSVFRIGEWFKAFIKKDINRIYPFLRIPDGPWRKMRTRKWLGIRTFNLAVWKGDFYKVNGFDEQFEGWGHEDADLAIRLINSFVLRKDGQFAIPVLHLWHKNNDRSNLGHNIKLLKQSVNQKIVAKNGLKSRQKVGPRLKT
jgi:glycosyltransferase involved in cell wall biosynthesis